MAAPPQSRSPDGTPELNADAAAAAAGPSLPADAIFEILSRTPIKSLCRFRCASREWRALIAGPAFLAAHDSRAGPLPLLAGRYYGTKDDGGLRFMDMDDGKVVREIKIDASRAYVDRPFLRLNLFDDQICLVEDRDLYTHMVDVATGEVLLTTEKLNETTSPPHRLNKPHYLIGAGHAALSGTLKAVRLSERFDAGAGALKQVCEVLELDLGAAGAGNECRWRDSRSPPTHGQVGIPCRRSAAATTSGVVHFLTSRGHVLRFDLEKEQWRKTVKGPPAEKNLRIAELNGALCMVGERWRAVEQPRVEIWRLSDPDESIWVKEYTIATGRYLMPLMVTPDDDGGKLLCSSLSLTGGIPPELLLYDLRNKTWKVRRMSDDDNLVGLVLCRLHLKHFVVQV